MKHSNFLYALLRAAAQAELDLSGDEIDFETILAENRRDIDGRLRRVKFD